jgi:long-subunit fatty acid transport protein
MNQHRMNRLPQWTAAVMLLVAATSVMQAQYPEDALRLGLSGTGVGARALAMGGAYTGIASDYSAIYWNPAGLAQMQYSEFTAGLSYLSTKDNSTFFGNSESYSNSNTALNSLGLANKVPTLRGNLVLAFGFHRQSNFVSGLSFTGFNPTSSIIQTYARNGARYPSDISDNIAYQLYLADIDTVNGTFVSPITNRVTQLAKVLESGGLNNWSVGGALDVAKDVSVGLTITYVTGTYRYDRTYEEQDRAQIYQSFPYDFDRYTLEEYIDGDISGFNAKFGLMYRVPDRFRLGLTVKTPTSFTVKENFGLYARAYYDNGDLKPNDKPFETLSSGEYGVRTPWVFGAGASVMLGDLVLSGDVEYTDWTQMEFKDANSDVMAQNRDFKTLFRPTADLRAGAEYQFGGGLRIRGGFMFNRSPYEGDPSSFDQKYITGGLGIPLGGSTMLDLTYARGWWDTFRTNYNSTSRVNESISTNTILATFSHRF